MTSDSDPSQQECLAYDVCTRCGFTMFPRVALLPCGHDDRESVKFNAPGVVYSWTQVARGDGLVPQLIVMVDFLDGDLRVAAPLVGASSVAIGDLANIRPGSENPYEFSLSELRST